MDKKIVTLEKEIMEAKKTLSKLRSQQSNTLIKDYTFQDHKGNSVRLSDLIGDRTELVMPFNMGKKCVYCTLWADGYNGLVQHLENRSAFTVVSPDPYEVQKEFHTSRNWEFKMVSSQDMQFYKDTGFMNGDEGTFPGVASFIKEYNGAIKMYSKSFFGHGDNFCVMWDFNDLLPPLKSEWVPKYNY